ncbi:MAG: polysaccharide deacetylase family protein [Dysgonamonadaceae bacterium]
MLLHGIFEQASSKKKVVQGGIVRGNAHEPKLALIFTGHEFADGAKIILKTLKKNKVKGSFFLTGDFYRKFPKLAKQLQKEGHYMAPHSDKHLLYADWTKRDSTLITYDEFKEDLQNNYSAIREAGLHIESPKYFMPPYEWYNNEISNWAKNLDVQVVNFTPGTTSNADYTTPDMNNYRSSREIFDAILSFEKKESLNGFILLLHIGTHPDRTDKLYNKLDDLIKELKKRGYELERIDELLK